MFLLWLRFRRFSIFRFLYPKPCSTEVYNTWRKLYDCIPNPDWLPQDSLEVCDMKSVWKYIYTLGLCCIHDIYQLGLTGHANQPKPWPSCISAIRPQTSKQWALSAPDIRIHGDGAKFRICSWQIWPSGSVGWEFLRQSVYVFCLIERRKMLIEGLPESDTQCCKVNVLPSFKGSFFPLTSSFKETLKKRSIRHLKTNARNKAFKPDIWERSDLVAKTHWNFAPTLQWLK